MPRCTLGVGVGGVGVGCWGGGGGLKAKPLWLEIRAAWHSHDGTELSSAAAVSKTYL